MFVVIKGLEVLIPLFMVAVMANPANGVKNVDEYNNNFTAQFDNPVIEHTYNFNN